jgi:transketolase
MGVVSQSNINVAGSHCGVSIGEDGPSQMALEDIAMFRTLPGCTVFYPSDAVSCERAVELAANAKGITFIRLSRPATPIVYENNHTFVIGKANIIKSNGADDKCLVIGAGVTLEQAMMAAKTLEAAGTKVRVMDPFTIKPLDVEAILKNAKECGGRIVVAEDHYPEGGISSAVADVVAGQRDMILKALCVREVPRSGPPKVLIEKYGIGASSIVKAVQDIIKA